MGHNVGPHTREKSEFENAVDTFNNELVMTIIQGDGKFTTDDVCALKNLRSTIDDGIKICEAVDMLERTKNKFLKEEVTDDETIY